jgi:hypothetical protein
MRKFALIAAAAVAGLASASVSRADFVYQIGTITQEPATVTSQGNVVANPLAGDDIVPLQIKFVAGVVQSNYAVAWNLNMSSTALTPQFFIRTWDAVNDTWDTGDAATAGSNADLANQGNLDSNSLVVNPRGSYLRIGGTSGFNLASSTPSENGTTFTDFQSLTGISVDEANSNQTSLGNSYPTNRSGTQVSTSFVTIGQAIVPHGQEVTFAGTVFSDLPTDTAGIPFTVSNVAVPEPASLGVIGILSAGLLARRRRV